jgi:hypothetical protein
MVECRLYLADKLTIPKKMAQLSMVLTAIPDVLPPYQGSARDLSITSRRPH